MRAPRLIAITVLALALGGGAVQEFVVPGLSGGETQPLVVGVAGIVVAVLCLSAAWLLWKQSAVAPKLAAVSGALAIVFHAYAALPPHRNVGVLALLLGIAVGVLLLLEAGAARHTGVIEAASR